MKLGLVFLARLAPVVLVCTAGCTPATSARSARSGHTEPKGPVYRFDFTLNATEGAVGASGVVGESHRHYSMVLEQGDEGRVEAASNVPLGPGERPPRTDAGVNVRCKYDLDGDALILHTVLSMSSAGTDGSNHAIHKIEMIGDALVAPGTPTLVSTIADPSNQSRYELSVAATRLD
jgi:hypothetical protein